VNSNGPIRDTLPPPRPPRSQLVGYTSPPVGFVSGDDLIDAALVGVTADMIVVAFRGTLSIDSQDTGQAILDWANDADAPLIPGANLPGLVHQGFLDSLDNLWGDVEPAVVAAMTANPRKPVCVTGHSKGGAIAHLAAARIGSTIAGANLNVQTFAAARSGDADFAAGYAARVPSSLRFEFADDIVPHLPPGPELLLELQALPIIGGQLGDMQAGYVSVGTLQYIPARAAPGAMPVADSPTLEADRIRSLIGLLETFQFETIKDDHAIDPTSGYANAVCPGF
jgi:hypothetical protein